MTKIRFKRTRNELPVEDKQDGDLVFVKESDGKLRQYNVLKDGNYHLVKGIDKSQEEKLNDLKTQSEISEEIDNKLSTAVSQAQGTPIVVTGSVLPQGVDVPAYITNIGVADLFGGDVDSKTYTQTGGEPITVSAGKFRKGFYNRSTDLWTASEELSLPRDISISIITNEEFLYAIVDVDGNLLWGKRRDGSTYDCDLSVYKYTDNQITDVKKLVSELNLSVEFIKNDYLSKSSVKNDRGDSVTDTITQKLFSDFADSYDNKISVITNQEFIYALVDKNDSILWGKRFDGSTYDCDLTLYNYTSSQISILNDKIDRLNTEANLKIDELATTTNNRLTPLEATRTDYQEFKSWMSDKFSVVSNQEFVYAIVDFNNVLLWGKRRDGSTYDSDKSIVEDVAELNYAVMMLSRDVDTRLDVLEQTDVDYFLFKKSINDKLSLISNQEFLYAIVDKNDSLLWGKRRDGSTYDSDKSIPNDIKRLTEQLGDIYTRVGDIENKNRLTIVTNNPEYLYAIVDVDGKFIEGIRADGVVKNIKSLVDDVEVVKKLTLSKTANTQLQKDLRDSGFETGSGVHSESTSFRLPIPKVPAKVNIIMNTLPVTKTTDAVGEVEYYDNFGNYFKKPIILNAQGSSSMAYDKKNFTIDFDDGSKAKFGDWVEQDSWHLKAHYTDAFKSNNNVAYDIFEELARKQPYTSSRVWNSVLGVGQTSSSGSGVFKKDFDTGARGFPDGFPIVLYHNGEFHGIYQWNLKKHRDNYKMERGNVNHIHLDGSVGFEEMFNGTVDWTQFEIRNPSPRQKQEGWILETTTGAQYNGDEPTEIASTGKTGQVKTAIQRLADSVNAIKASPTKQTFESYFSNIWMFEAYLIVANILGNNDSFRKNWQWVTYDGGLTWTIAPYDWDGGLGVDNVGNTVGTMQTHQIGLDTETPMKYFWQIYQTEIKAKYNQLKSSGFLTSQNIFSMFKKRIDWVGVENFDKENKKWSNMPSYRDSRVSDNWTLKNRLIVTSSINYNPNTTYNVGQEVVYGVDAERYVFVAKVTTTGVAPLSGFYNMYPRTLGFYNSMDRIYKWLDERITITNNIYL